jgi:hypothetical protein
VELDWNSVRPVLEAIAAAIEANESDTPERRWLGPITDGEEVNVQLGRDPDDRALDPMLMMLKNNGYLADTSYRDGEGSWSKSSSWLRAAP